MSKHAIFVKVCDDIEGDPVSCFNAPNSYIDMVFLESIQANSNSSFLPEITASEAAMLCSAIALLLGTAWIFKQIVRAMKFK